MNIGSISAEGLSSQISETLKVYAEMQHELELFAGGVSQWFSKHPQMAKEHPPLVHSVRFRLKDPLHLTDKLKRKFVADQSLTFLPSDLGLHVTDLAGVRVLHLHQSQFARIHKLFCAKVDSGDWYLDENPKAYTWDPESRDFFLGLGLKCELKESHYTSVHYVIRPKPNTRLSCEIQVRTLFEETWGEVEHSLNYPDPTDNVSCKEQLRVLSKIVGAGSRLVDSIFRVSEENTKGTKEE